MENNINALQEMSLRMLEAIQRNMWNDSQEYENKLQELLIDLDNKQEQTHA